MAKIHPKGIIAVKAGPTITKNDPAKFRSAGKTSGKMDGAKQVVHQATGPTLTCNESHIPAMNADVPSKHKQLGVRSTSGFKPQQTVASKTATQSGSGAPSDREYPLKKSYEKSGAHSSQSPRKVF